MLNPERKPFVQEDPITGLSVLNLNLRHGDIVIPSDSPAFRIPGGPDNPEIEAVLSLLSFEVLQSVFDSPLLSESPFPEGDEASTVSREDDWYYCEVSIRPSLMSALGRLCGEEHPSDYLTDFIENTLRKEDKNGA